MKKLLTVLLLGIVHLSCQAQNIPVDTLFRLIKQDNDKIENYLTIHDWTFKGEQRAVDFDKNYVYMKYWEKIKEFDDSKNFLKISLDYYENDNTNHTIIYHTDDRDFYKEVFAKIINTDFVKDKTKMEDNVLLKFYHSKRYGVGVIVYEYESPKKENEVKYVVYIRRLSYHMNLINRKK